MPLLLLGTTYGATTFGSVNNDFVLLGRESLMYTTSPTAALRLVGISDGRIAQIDGTIIASQAEAITVGIGNADANATRDNSVIISASGIITSMNEAVLAFSAGMMVTNFGQVTTTARSAFVLQGAGSEVVNHGWVTSALSGVEFQARGNLVNAGNIAARDVGVSVAPGAGNSSIRNDGSLSAANGSGVQVEASGARVTNTGELSGGVAGLSLETASANGRIVNHGRIDGADWGVRLKGVGQVLANSGVVSGQTVGVAIEGAPGLNGASGNRLVNAGTIISAGASGAAPTPAAILIGDDAVGTTVLNRGDVIGDIVAGTQAEVILNTGTITGDVVLGGGNDLFRSTLGATSGIVHGGTGRDALTGSKMADDLRGDGGPDTLKGLAGDDALFGGNGDDLVFGGNGDDVIDGGLGRDDLRGGNGDDTLDGGDSNDTLDGGRGDDLLTGGTGNDVFLFRLGAGNDEITDFTDDRDALHLDQRLWAGTKTAAEVVADHASLVVGKVIFDFGAGQSVTISGVGVAADLIDDILLI